MTGAAAKGGWVPIVISKVCSQTAGPERTTHLHRLVGMDRTGRPEHVPDLGAERRAARRGAGRRPRSARWRRRPPLGRHHRAGDHDRLQRVALQSSHLHQHGHRDPGRDRHRLRSGEHALHHRRDRRPRCPARSTPARSRWRSTTTVQYRLVGQRGQRRTGAAPRPSRSSRHPTPRRRPPRSRVTGRLHQLAGIPPRSP